MVFTQKYESIYFCKAEFFFWCESFCTENRTFVVPVRPTLRYLVHYLSRTWKQASWLADSWAVMLFLGLTGSCSQATEAPVTAPGVLLQHHPHHRVRAQRAVQLVKLFA